MKSQLRQKAIDLRINEELSYGGIKKKVRVSKSTLSYWLRDLPLNKDRLEQLRIVGWTKGELSRERFRTTMRLKREAAERVIYNKYKEQFKIFSEDSFLVSGLALYLAEGDKRNRAKIALANTDPNVGKFFIRWLEYFFNVPRSKFRIHLQLYEDMNIENEINFWIKTLCLKRDQAYKPFVRKLSPNSFSYAGSFRHGTCSVQVSDTKLKTEVTMAIKAFVDSILNNS